MDGRCKHCGAKERSRKSHGHFFWLVENAWLHLPEHLQERFASSEHLRKWCLIRAGFRDERTVIFPTAEEAERAVLFGMSLDEFAVLNVDGCIVTIWTAKSQKVSRKNSDDGMDRADFQASKDAVFSVIAKMVGVTVQEIVEAPPLAPEAREERERERADG